MGKRFPRLFVVLSIFLLTSLLTTATAFSSNARNELVIISRDTQVFDKDATVLDFPITIVRFGHGESVGEIVNFKINGNELYDKIEKSQSIDVHRIDDAIDHADFKQWMEYRKNVSILKIRNDDELLLSMPKDHDVNLTHAINKLRDRTTGILPSPILVDVTDLPFSLSSDMILTVEITVESGKDHVTWEGEALIVDIEPLSVNPVWTPADLHLHTAFSDGAYAPSGFTTQLNSKGYKLAYIVDEPVGWGITQIGFTPKMSGTGDPATNSQLPSNRYDRLPYLATWAQYRDGVRSGSTVNVALFPGAEISASNQEFSHNGVHNGHALAYGIVNLTGSTSFDTTGLRYNWFLPNTVLKNINLNNSGVSSSSLAHVYNLFYPWNVWGANLTERYDGMELMSAGQYNFSPSQNAMVKWRQELLHRLPGVCDLLPYMTGAEKIVIIDAIKGGGRPGAIYRLAPQDCGEQSKEDTLSLHDLGIMVVLQDLALLEKNTPSVVIIGVEPREIDWGMELTPEVERSLPRLLELVKSEIGFIDRV
jgi:hydrogenase maturation protease